MSAHWIKLTGRDGADLFVNMASATMMRPRKHWTRIWFMGARDDHVDVFESPAEIVVSLDEQLARHMPASQPEPPTSTPTSTPTRTPTRIEPAPVYVEPQPRPLSPARADIGAQAPRAAGMNGVAAKLSRASAIKVSTPLAAKPFAREPFVASPEEPPAHPPTSETVAEQREQRARRRVSAVMDARRQELARKLEAMKREKGAE